jgi:hypothetical protein
MNLPAFFNAVPLPFGPWPEAVKAQKTGFCSGGEIGTYMG